MAEPNQAAERTVLIATRADIRSAPWIDQVASAREAMKLWRQRRHNYVFADMADHGEGMTGARLSLSLRKEAGGQAVIIVLLCDSMAAYNLERAKLSRANSVVRRDAAAIAAALPPQPERLMRAAAC